LCQPIATESDIADRVVDAVVPILLVFDTSDRSHRSFDTRETGLEYTERILPIEWSDATLLQFHVQIRGILVLKKHIVSYCSVDCSKRP
jgi:hypothetical protein